LWHGGEEALEAVVGDFPEDFLGALAVAALNLAVLALDGGDGAALGEMEGAGGGLGVGLGLAEGHAAIDEDGGEQGLCLHDQDSLAGAGEQGGEARGARVIRVKVDGALGVEQVGALGHVAETLGGEVVVPGSLVECEVEQGGTAQGVDGGAEFFGTALSHDFGGESTSA